MLFTFVPNTVDFYHEIFASKFCSLPTTHPQSGDPDVITGNRRGNDLRNELVVRIGVAAARACSYFQFKLAHSPTVFLIFTRASCGASATIRFAFKPLQTMLCSFPASGLPPRYYPYSTVIMREHLKNIPLKSCNIARIFIKLLERFLKYCRNLAMFAQNSINVMLLQYWYFILILL